MSYTHYLRDSNQGVEQIRRDLHRHPETAFQEFRTASLVAQTLSEAGYQVSTGAEVMRAAEIVWPLPAATIAAARTRALAHGAVPEWVEKMGEGLTGVVARLRRGEGPVVAFRFDMDALPVTEVEQPGHRPFDEGFLSQWKGAMHACGHDGHTAIGLAVAARLAADPSWQGELRLIFQPAEEGTRGARPMVAAGVVDDVDYFFVAHLGCNLPSGKIACNASKFYATVKMDVTFRGRAAHAAMGPQEGGNALLAGAMAAQGLFGISRHGEQMTFVNVGKMTSGTARNIIAETCVMECEVRGETTEAKDYMYRRALEVIRGAALAQGIEVEIDEGPNMPGNSNSPEVIAAVGRAAARVAGITEVLADWPIGGGDDATMMIRRVQERGGKAGYFLIGSDIAAIHHAKNFDIDESALAQGVDVFTELARDLLRAP